jgi:surface antigen
MAGEKRLMGFGVKVRLLMVGIVLAGSSLFGGHEAAAAAKHPARHSVMHVAARRAHHYQVAVRHTHHYQVASRHLSRSHLAYAGHHHYRVAAYRFHRRYASYRHSGLQCVPYAREVSHIELSGNAFLWWAEAAGRYARGNEPVEGAVLNFRAIGRMPLGHVAVVTDVINSRTILVTQANWVRGTITNDVTVQDVSPDNDWTQVQVELGDSRTWGAAYPTYGFIYNQPATSTVIAASGQANEVAEAPVAQPVSTEAPNRSLQ